MKLVSWNVNGLRAIQQKGFSDYFNEVDADIFCLQETKLHEHQVELQTPGYHQYWSFAEKKGYSGTALFSKTEPLSVEYGIGHEFDDEGRVICAEFEEFYVVTVYTPNSQEELARLNRRMEWDDMFREYVKALAEHKGVIICGDLNVAHQAIDLKNPKTNERNAGYTIEEREKFTQLLEAGFVDTFRYLYPDVTGVYSWWSYRFQSRSRNTGWRIDYWLVSESLKERVIDSTIATDVMGSDHAPVILVIQNPVY
ncbi:MAG: exodeoxyribonuclease III [Spirochaetales bacterium]|nr:exodeoxyribonuclease III [Spirochaetales bacterium]